MSIKQQPQGYILVLTMLVLSLATLLVTQLAYQATNHIYFDRTMIDREKAKTLALSGISIVQSKLTFCKKLKPEDPKAQFLVHNFPSINKLQEFGLTEAVDGIDATIAMVLMVEEGKINLNQLYDFKEKKFKNEGKGTGDARKFIQNICEKIQDVLKVKDLFKGLDKFLKERTMPLEDVSELLLIPEFAQAFKASIFYTPEKSEKARKQKKVYLTDIFTVWTTTEKINVAYLSESMLTLLGLQGAYTWDLKKRKELIEGYLKEKKPAASIATQWDTYLKPFYGKEFKALPKGWESFFMIEFVPTIFSVLSYATIGAITQKIFAIIEKKKKDEQEIYRIVRLFWL